MEVSAVTTDQAQQASVIAGRDLAENFDNFLMLLITQLRNQDPLSPMDTNEFTSQIVRFAGVEQAIATNSNLEQLIALQRANQAAGLIGYLGQRIEANGNTTALADGRAEWNYALPGAANQVTLLVTNEAGRAIYSTTGATEAGAHQFVWSGLDDAGNPMPEGQYTLAVTATDPEGNSMTATMTTVGTVTGIETAGDGPVLFVGKSGVPLGEVLAILGTLSDQQGQQEQT